MDRQVDRFQIIFLYDEIFVGVHNPSPSPTPNAYFRLCSFSVCFRGTMDITNFIFDCVTYGDQHFYMYFAQTGLKKEDGI